MTDQAAALSRQYGGDPSQHEASELTTTRINAASLIVTMTREHRAEVVSLVPRASRKTFTLREFDRLIRTYQELDADAGILRDANAAGLDSFVHDVAAMRGFSTVPVLAADDSVVDPYRQAQEVYDEAGQLISQSVTRVAEALVDITQTAPSSRRDDLSRSARIDQDQGRSAQQQRGER
jgi:protein-tyrosine phosphatase